MPEVPRSVLRSVVAGIGRIMNFADKVRNKPAGAGVPVGSAAPETAAPETTAPEAAASGTVTAEAKPDTIIREDEPETTAPEPAAELPLPNYDELTIQSVRARLRNLSVAQLRELIEYEKGHADRADFITAYERRIAKVESGN